MHFGTVVSLFFIAAVLGLVVQWQHQDEKVLIAYCIGHQEPVTGPCDKYLFAK